MGIGEKIGGMFGLNKKGGSELSGVGYDSERDATVWSRFNRAMSGDRTLPPTDQEKFEDEDRRSAYGELPTDPVKPAGLGDAISGSMDNNKSESNE